MTDKDPKDMTASELLRLAAGEGEQGNWSGTVRKLAHLVGISDLRICELNNCDLLDESYKIIADKIDAELAQARKEAVKESKKPMWWFRFAISQGEDWPEPQEGESFRHYLDRCFIPRPRFEDGEPVQFGDSFLRWDGKGGNDGENVVEITVLSGDYYRWGINGDCCTSQPAKRPVPEALGADGLPIVVGETAYRIDRPTTEIKILYIRSYDDGSSDVVYCEGDPSLTKMCDPSLITHTPPDTQERIDEDATILPRVYYARHIGHDVGLKGDTDVTEAMVLDLLRRQRELDKRTGGE